jgi:hypothetical protein
LLLGRADAADAVADWARDTLAAEDLHTVPRRPVIHLPLAAAMRAGVIRAGPWQDELTRFSGGEYTAHAAS